VTFNKRILISNDSRDGYVKSVDVCEQNRIKVWFLATTSFFLPSTAAAFYMLVPTVADSKTFSNFKKRQLENVVKRYNAC